jgi:transposase
MLRGTRRRPRTLHDLNKRVERALSEHGVSRYIIPAASQYYEDTYLQERGGPATITTRYHRVPKAQLKLSWTVDEDAVRRDAKMDGIYPLLANDPSLSPEKVLTAHKGHPRIEKRFQQAKGTFEITPVFLKNEGRIEAFFTVFFIAMVVQAVIERRVRAAMATRNLEALPLYPEQRLCKQPTAEQILRLFSHVQRHHLRSRKTLIKTFEPELTPLQLQALALLGVSPHVFETS